MSFQDKRKVKISKKVKKRWKRTEYGDTLWNYGAGQIKLDPFRVAPTLTKCGDASYSFFHYSEPRPINIEEMKILASFPKTFVFCGSYKDIKDRIGNAIPPNIMRVIAEKIAKGILMKSKFNIISTFSGCGGSSLGYKMAGGKVLLAVEWDDNAVETYKINFSETKVYHGDIHNLTVDECKELAGVKTGELDILDGSPPCQGFSTAGKRVLKDDRNNLYKEYIRLLNGLQPRVFVMENVSGLVKGKMKLVFAQILKEMKSCGYIVKVKLMNAKYYNVPQSRKRLIFIGVRKDLDINPCHPKPQSRPITVKEAIGDLNNIQNKKSNHTWLDESPSGRNTKSWKKAKIAKQGEIYAGYQRRCSWNKPAPTLLTGGVHLGGSHCHPEYTRTFSVLEYKKLSSFPDNFKFIGSKKDAVSRIGNAVPPNMMKVIANNIKKEILNKIEAV